MTQYTLITTLPRWIVVLVDNCLTLLANITGSYVYSFIRVPQWGELSDEPQTQNPSE